MKKIIKEYKFLFIYSIIIIVILLFILFAVDDKYFIKKNNNTINTKEKSKTIDYKKQLEQLLNENYSYHYDLNYNGETYKCEGIKKKEEEKGKCIEPESIEYNNDNYQEVFKNINTKYLDVNYIYNIIKELDPEMTNLNVKRYYTYDVNILNMKGNIIVYSDLSRITQITIANGYLTYVLYFDNIK